MSKISQLTTSTDVASNDLIEIVDVSDNATMAGTTTGSNKKITVGTLLSNVNSYHTHDVVTTTAPGFMESADKIKLDGLTNYTNLPITRVGSLNYLDIDLKADFKGPQSTDYNKPYIFEERDGSIVGLRGGYDGLYKRQFYFYAGSLDDLQNAIITDIEYRPSFLSPTEFVSELADCNEHGLFVSIGNTVNSNLKYYWINLNGTLDSKAHTYVDLTSNVFASSGIGDSAVVYCPEKNLFIKTTLVDPGTSAPIAGRTAIKFSIYNGTTRTLIGSEYTQTDLNTSLTLGTYLGKTINTAYFNHTQRPNIQYAIEGNTLYLSHLISLTLAYSSGVQNVCYNSVAIYNITANTWSNQYNSPYNFNPDDTSTHLTPFFGGGSTVLGDYQENISLRKILKLKNDKIIVTQKPHAWDPSIFFTRVHTINSGYTWKDVVLRPFDLINSPTTRETNRVSYVPDDSSLLGKRLWFPAWLSTNRMFSVNYSKNANEPSLTWKTAIVDFDSNLTNSNTSVTAVSENTLPEIRTRNPYHTTLDSAGNMRVKVVSGSKIIEINGATLAITNNNVNTLPSNYQAQFDALIGADRVALGLATGLQTKNIFYHVVNGLYILAYGFYIPTPVPTVNSYFRIVEVVGSAINAVGSPVLAATYTDAQHSSNTGTSYPPTLAQVAGDYSIQTNNSCGIYNHSSTACYIIFKGTGAEAPGTQSFPRIAVNLNPTTKTITAWSRVGTRSSEYAQWHTEFLGVHPFYGPCSMIGHVDLYSKIKMRFYDNTTVTSFQQRMLAGFNTALAGTNFTSDFNTLTLQSAKGFNVFVSTTPVFLQGTYYTLPTQSVNLADPAYFGPTNVKNKTIYVYVELINNLPELVFLLTKEFDSTKFIYIGTIVTDNLGIISSDIEKLSKIDTLQVNGSVTILEGPFEENHAATKKYVDDTVLANKPGVATTITDGLLSSTDKNKLDGIAAGAQINVNADWTSTSGDSQILNKPGVATTTTDGLLSSTDKSKLDNLTNYVHPTGDGNLHVPATGTTNNGKVLTAGATAGSLSWVDPAAIFTSNQSKAVSGYQKLPGDVILQWGKSTGLADGGTVTFPLAFPNVCTFVGITPIQQSDSTNTAITINTRTLATRTTFQIERSGAYTSDFQWFAIGY